MPKKKTGAKPGKKQTTQKRQAKPAANKKPRATAANNAANAEKRAAQASKAAATPPKAKSASVAKDQGQQAAPKKPPKRKNVSQTISNGTLIITNDKCFYGTDGKSDKQRMAVTVDSNRNDELAIVKYTTSIKHGRPFDNSKGFVGHGDKIYTLDENKKPIKADGKKFIAQGKREITTAQANEIKRRNVKESKYKAGNRKNLQNLKKRKK